MSDCPCKSESPYDTCCGPIITGARKAATAAELMRSRYTAFANGSVDWIEASHDPETRGDFDVEQTREWSQRSEWHGFEVVRTEAGGPEDREGQVEFIAHYSIQGTPIDHHEISHFRRDGDTWYFRDGKEVPVTVRRDSPKVGRNDPCPCGSGKKHKKCCG